MLLLNVLEVKGGSVLVLYHILQLAIKMSRPDSSRRHLTRSALNSTVIPLHVRTSSFVPYEYGHEHVQYIYDTDTGTVLMI